MKGRCGAISAGKPILDFSEPLTGDQLAPFGFLIAQRALMAVLGTSTLRVAADSRWRAGSPRSFCSARAGSPHLAAAAGPDRAGLVRVFRRPDLLLERAEAVLAGPGGRAGDHAWRLSMPCDRPISLRRAGGAGALAASPPRGFRLPRRLSSRAAA